MPTKVRFETGVLSDAIKKAARVAPSRGGAELDKAAGIILDIDPGGAVPCVVRATDTMTFYLESLAVTEATGDKVRWRLPSQLLAGLLSNAISKATTITVETSTKSTGRVSVKYARLTSDINLIASSSYPTWSTSAGDTLSPVTNLGEAISMVEWCAAKNGQPPLNGVNMDGKFLFATDRFRMARVPLKVDNLDEAIVFPAFSLGGIISGMGAVRVGVDRKLLVIQPNEFSQFKSITVSTAFPAGIYNRFEFDYPESLTFNRKEVIERIANAVLFSGADRDPVVELWIGEERMAVYIENAEVGLFGDIIDLPGMALHKNSVLKFAPKFLLEALLHSPTDEMRLGYQAAFPTKAVILSSATGYEAIVMPRADKKPAS